MKTMRLIVRRIKSGITLCNLVRKSIDKTKRAKKKRSEEQCIKKVQSTGDTWLLSKI
jgi:hypothetical protein